MARIKNEIEIKDRANIRDLVAKFAGGESNIRKNKLNCLFHNENTPSMSISIDKGLATCFGACGRSWNPLQLVMDIENLDYREALLWVANFYSITVEYEEETPEAAAKRKVQKNETEKALNDNLKVLEKFQSQLTPEITSYLNQRGYSEKQIQDLGLGYCIDDTSELWNDRIIWPIHNHKGELIAFAGRVSPSNDSKSKYVNSTESLIYQKKRVLYNYHRAKSAIQKKGFVIVCEGYTDVDGLFANGYENAVCTGGTAFTEEMAKFLMTKTKNVTFFFDSDKAGRSATEKAVHLATKAGLNARVAQLPEGLDPGDIYKIPKKADGEYSNFHKWVVDALETEVTIGVHYLVEAWRPKTNDSFKQAEWESDVATLLADVGNEGIRSVLTSELCTNYKSLQLSNLKKAIKLLQEEEVEFDDDGYFNEYNLPTELSTQLMKKGFIELSKNVERFGLGYHFALPRAKALEHIANFHITPLYHIYGEDNKRLIKINNGIKEITLDIPSESIVKASEFQKRLSKEGEFFFIGTPKQFMTIMWKIGHQFTMATELETPGWNSEGFWTFSNGIFNSKFHMVNEDGMVGHGENMYFLPAESAIYKKLKNQKTDRYENERFYSYQPTEHKLKDVLRLIYQAYSQNNNGMIGIAFLVASLFRDHIYGTQNCFPHLFLHGESQAGKSQLGWTLSNIFTPNLQPYNLHIGTIPAFSKRLGRAINTIAAMDEYNDEINEIKFQALKSSYDGIGREKMGGANYDNVSMDKVFLSLVLMGQYLPNRDDNALTNRSILCEFHKVNSTERDDNTVNAHAILKEWEKQGLSQVITEIVKYRKLIEQGYAVASHDLTSRFRNDLKSESIDERITRNFISILAPMQILQEVIPFPFTFEQLYKLCLVKAVAQVGQMATTDALNAFWVKIQFLIREGRLKRDTDFKIIHTEVLQVSTSKGPKDRNFDKIETFVLFHFDTFYEAYKKGCRETGDKILPKNSVGNYLKVRSYYIGYKDSFRIGGLKSSIRIVKQGDDFPVDLNIVKTETDDGFKPVGETPTPSKNNKLPF